jgi:hypothetical protein
MHSVQTSLAATLAVAMLLGCGGSKNGSKPAALDASQTSFDVVVYATTTDTGQGGGDTVMDVPQDEVAASADAAQDAVPDSSDVGQEDGTTSDGDGVTIDPRPFVINYVNDGIGADIDVQLSQDSISANWSIDEPENGIAGYEWAIGTSPDSENIRPFTSVGTQSQASASGLTLPLDGTVIYVTVRATNRTGLRRTASSDGVQVGCSVEGTLYAGGARVSSDNCLTCLPAVRADAFSPRPEGTVPCPANGCGLFDNGCGGLKNCGTCQTPQTCGGGGSPNVCGCTPSTCSMLQKNCGQVSDGCGGTIDCGVCASPNHCGPLNLCGRADNVIIYSNYDGGTFTINVDNDIPNLAIGIVSYRNPVVTIAGAYAGNVVAVAWAGAGTASATSITGVVPAIVTAESMPRAPSPGPSAIICGYVGDPGYSTSGCNTRDQIRSFFLNKFGGQLLFQNCQYAEYTGVLYTSAGGTCDCRPWTCATSHTQCGTAPDGCGGTLNCGGCPVPETCGGMGTPNICGGCGSGQILSLLHYPTTVVNDSSIGALSWTSPTAAERSDGTPAEVSAMTGGASYYLKATNFRFNLPVSATVQGIYVAWERKALSGVGLADNATRIVKDSVVQTADRSRPDTWPSGAYVRVLYGGATDLWGTTWSVADVNSTGFGAALSVAYVSTAGNDWPEVDSVGTYVCYQ